MGTGNTSTAPPTRVFISHAFDDHAIAELVRNSIEARGVSCWIAPRDIMPGEDYPAAIQRGIAECNTMVLIFTANASSSKFVKREVTLAVEHNAVIVPFRTEDVRPEKDLAFNLAGVHWLDAVAPPLEQHLRTLSDRVAAIATGDIANQGAAQDAAREQKRNEMAAHERKAALGKRAAVAVMALVLLAGGVYLAQRPHRPADAALRSGLEHKLDNVLGPLGVRIDCDACGDGSAHVNVRVEDGNATLRGALSPAQQQVLRALPLQGEGVGSVSYSIVPLNAAQPAPPPPAAPVANKLPVEQSPAVNTAGQKPLVSPGNTERQAVRPQPAAEDDDATRVRQMIAKGRAQLAAGNTVSAASYFNSALDLDPDNAAAKAGLQAAQHGGR